MKFTKSPEKAAAPLLLVEFRTQPYTDEPPKWHSYIEVGLHVNVDLKVRIADIVKEDEHDSRSNSSKHVSTVCRF